MYPEEVTKPGFLNLCHFSDDCTDLEKTKADITFLDPFCEAGQCTELYAGDCLEFFHARFADQILNNWLSKLSIDGTITISGTDIYETMTFLLNRTIGMEQLNTLLYGDRVKLWEQKKSVYSCHQICSTLEPKGIKIIKKVIDNYKYSIVGKRV